MQSLYQNRAMALAGLRHCRCRYGAVSASAGPIVAGIHRNESCLAKPDRFHRQYSPFIATFEGQHIVPAESAYAVFEAKQTATAAHVGYAQDKAATVRGLYRTSMPIPHAGGTYPPKPPLPILAGLLTFESDWNPPLGSALKKALAVGTGDRHLDLGCVAAHGYFCSDESLCHVMTPGGKPATAFLLELIAQLQAIATVPMVDVRAYSAWLDRGKV
jgi:hypothetical protein